MKIRIILTGTILSLLTPLISQAKDEAKIEANKHKLDIIVLPDVEFSEIPLSSAISQIRDLTIKSEPEGKGVNFVLKQAAENPSKLIKITLSMKQPTLGQALAEIGKQANLKIVPEEYAIALVEEK